MNIFNIVVNPSYSKTNWFRDFCIGAKQVAMSKGAELKIWECGDDTDEICRKCLETSGLAILVSSSSAWENEILRYFSRKGVHSIIIRPSVMGENLLCSSVSIDYFGTTLEIMKYFFEIGCRRIAYFAYNKDSSQDNRKYGAYKNAFSYTDIPFLKDDVYKNSGSLSDCTKKLKARICEYDAVLCANDAAAISLINEIRACDGSLPCLASFGNTRLLKIIYPDIISVSLNFTKAGEAACWLYLYLLQNKSISSAEYIISSEVDIPNPVPRICTFDFSEKTERQKRIPFYEDKAVIEIFDFENALSLCDELDIDILSCISKGLTYEQIAEKTNTAVTTVKYRLKKIYSYFGVSSRAELLEFLGKYM